jgi:hypothetical protein
MSENSKPLKKGELGLNSGSKAKKLARLSTIYQKKKELAMISENPAKVYVIVSKTVS